MSFEIYEKTGGIPFTDIKWGERLIGGGSTNIYVDFEETPIDPGEGTLMEDTGILTTVTSYEDLEGGETQYFVRTSLYQGVGIPSISVSYDVSDSNEQSELYDFLYDYKTKNVKIKYTLFENDVKIFTSIEEI